MVVISAMIMPGGSVLERIGFSIKATPATARFCADPLNFDEGVQFGMNRESCILHVNQEFEECKAQLTEPEDAIQACAESRYRAHRIPEG